MKGRTLLGALLAALLLLSEAGCQSWCERCYPCSQPAYGQPCCQPQAYQPVPSYAPPVQQIQPVPAYQGAPQGYPCPPCTCTPSH
jgi:hypothetical protein